MKDYTYVLDELNSFPSAKELFPFKYLTNDELVELSKLHPIKPDVYLKDFQEATRSDEWKAVSIVTQKYKRKYEINTEYLIRYLTNWSKDRILLDKAVHKDILIQECSKYVKDNCKKY